MPIRHNSLGMGLNRITGLGDAVNERDAVNKSQLDEVRSEIGFSVLTELSESSDNSTVIENQLNSSPARTWIIPPGTWDISDIRVTRSGFGLKGHGSGFDQSVLRITNTTGHGIFGDCRSGTLEGFVIDGTTARRDSGASVTQSNGLFIGHDDSTTAPSRSDWKVRDVISRNQPGHGFYATGQLQGLVFEDCTARDCWGHSLCVDDGTWAGFTNKAIGDGIITVKRFFHYDVGGGFVIGHPSQTYAPYRLDYEQLELVDGGWNSSIWPSFTFDGVETVTASGDVQAVNYRDNQIYIFNVQTVTGYNCGFGNPGYANTSTTGGIAIPSPKTIHGNGMFLWADNFVISTPRLIDVERGILVASGASAGLIQVPKAINSGSYVSNIMIDIESGTDNISIETGDQSGIDILVRSKDAGTRWKFSEKQFRPIPGFDGFYNGAAKPYGFQENTLAPQLRVISGGNLTIYEDFVKVSPSGATTLNNIYVPQNSSGTIIPPEGWRVTLINTGSANVNITAAGNIAVAETLSPQKSISYVSDGSKLIAAGAGASGADGADGADGVGVVAGGTTGQVLAKASDTDFDTEWVDQSAGGGGVTAGEAMLFSELGF